MKSVEEKLHFYEHLGIHYQQIAVNGPKYIYGDMTTRIGHARQGESDILGEFCFGIEARHRVEIPNRDLLMDFCWSRQMVVANTTLPAPDESKVTFRELRIPPMAPITPLSFSMLDLLLMPARHTDRLVDIQSDRLAVLATQHFPVVATITSKVEDTRRSERRKSWIGHVYRIASIGQTSPPKSRAAWSCLPTLCWINGEIAASASSLLPSVFYHS
jgi:hypothetical protein